MSSWVDINQVSSWVDIKKSSSWVDYRAKFQIFELSMVLRLYTFEGCPLLINDNEDKQKPIYIIQTKCIYLSRVSYII